MLKACEVYKTTDGLIKLTKDEEGLKYLFFFPKANGKNKTN